MLNCDILRILIKESIQVSVSTTTECGGRVLVLVDSGKNGKQYKIKITHVPPNVFVYKSDAFQDPVCHFQGSKGENKRADYVIISDNPKVILYIELKSGRKEQYHVAAQLRGSACQLKMLHYYMEDYFHEDSPCSWDDYKKVYCRLTYYSQKQRINRRSHDNIGGDGGLPRDHLHYRTEQISFGEIIKCGRLRPH